MILKAHLCGIAVAYDEPSNWKAEESDNHKKVNPYATPDIYETSVRPQGSLYGWQKRKIADATEYMRLHAVHRPIIFVATTPGFIEHKAERKAIARLTQNLRNGYDCKNYVWVREFTQKGFPHYHFVADMPDFNAVKLSRYWSGLFGSDAVNSIRLGSAPDKNGKRNYYLKGHRHAWYLTKYLSKSIGSNEVVDGKRRSFRTFSVSEQLALLSQPQIFKSEYEYRTVTTLNGFTGHYDTLQVASARGWQNCTDRLTDDQVNARWHWQYTGFANTFKGFPLSWQRKQKRNEKI